MPFQKHNHFFILGNPRSGTSLLRRILDEHSCISIPPESNFLVGLYPEYTENRLSDEKKAQLLVDLFQFSKFEDLKLDRHSLENRIFDKSISNFSDIYTEIQRQYAGKMDKDIQRSKFFFGEKNRFWRDKAKWISKCFPDAIILHIVRDPRDIVVSYFQLNLQNSDNPHHPKLESDPLAIVKEWVLNNDRIREMGKNHPYWMVKYEELILHTISSMDNILDFFGLDHEDSIFEYYKKEIFGVTEPVSHKSWKAKLTEAPDKTNIGKFENFLSAMEIDRIYAAFKTEMADYGY